MRDAEERHFTAWGRRLTGLFRPGRAGNEGSTSEGSTSDERPAGERWPILALHGWLDNAESFAPLADHLPNPILALDFSGHGHSDHAPAELATHLIDHVRAVLEVSDQMGWERFVLMGHSMGAGVASLFAATFPERLQRLVLLEGLGPPATPADEVAPTLRKAIEQMRALPEKRKPVYTDPQQAVAARMPALGGMNESSARLLCQRGLMPVPGGWTWRTDIRLRATSSLRLTDEQVEGFIRRIKAPTLLVLADDGLGGAGRFAHREAWVPHLTRIDLPGRHHVHMDDPEPVGKVIRNYLNNSSLDPRSENGHRETPRNDSEDE